MAGSHKKQTTATQSARCALDDCSARPESFSKSVDSQQETWVALLGRMDEPTDGVEDYCTFLSRALTPHGVGLRRVRVPWADEGWARALRGLWHEASAWSGRWVLLQYTALGWSRRGFPFGALRVMTVLRRAGARVAVVFHEPSRQSSGSRWVDVVRGACQDWVIHRLYHRTAKAIFTVPLETAAWLPKGDGRAAFIPIGANIPERVVRRAVPPDTNQEKTVIVFGVTGALATDSEVEEIATVIKETSKVFGKLRLVVVGRGAAEAREQLERSLEGVNVGLVVRGILPAEEIAHEFERADAQLFVRGAATPQRGSVIAGIACGLPIVAYQNRDISEPLREAGVEWSPWRDRDALVRGLVRVLSDPTRWLQLHERNLNAQKNHFAWGRIAERYRTVLAQ